MYHAQNEAEAEAWIREEAAANDSDRPKAYKVKESGKACHSQRSIDGYTAAEEESATFKRIYKLK